MILKSKNIPENIKLIKPLNYKRIKIKSGFISGLPWNSAEYKKDAVYEPPVRLKEILWQMLKTCIAYDGIGLSACQIGIYSKLFIMSEFIYNTETKTYEATEDFREYIHPSWKKTEDAVKVIDIEGCLSVPDTNVPIKRWNKIEAEWFEYDETGGLIYKKEILEELPARCFQHEFNHLENITIIEQSKK